MYQESDLAEYKNRPILLPIANTYIIKLLRILFSFFHGAKIVVWVYFSCRINGSVIFKSFLDSRSFIWEISSFQNAAIFLKSSVLLACMKNKD
ncbi:hypothetical protein XELAEV_18014916mg [Xenopus laevis]|uniref:Uncharacterized protein n=1 Tax=Xenopus laevis TaxID=8355 RepID=A0A974DH10_XENLA|nr:hypothetical protein XELAEV_18014916mg [Xenopus laevis]